MPFSWDNNDLVLHVVVQTQASSDQIVGIHGEQIRIRIRAAAIEGQANKQLIKFLAKQFGVPKSQVLLEKGQRSRYKRLKIVAPRKWPIIIQPS